MAEFKVGDRVLAVKARGDYRRIPQTVISVTEFTTSKGTQVVVETDQTGGGKSVFDARRGYIESELERAPERFRVSEEYGGWLVRDHGPQFATLPTEAAAWRIADAFNTAVRSLEENS